jgi:hypothetical protein
LWGASDEAQIMREEAEADLKPFFRRNSREIRLEQNGIPGCRVRVLSARSFFSLKAPFPAIREHTIYKI